MEMHCIVGGTWRGQTGPSTLNASKRTRPSHDIKDNEIPHLSAGPSAAGGDAAGNAHEVVAASDALCAVVSVRLASYLLLICILGHVQCIPLFPSLPSRLSLTFCLVNPDS